MANDEIVPIGAARPDDAQDCVLVVGISPDQFATLPEYRPDPFDRDNETALVTNPGHSPDVNAEPAGSELARRAREA